MILLSSSVDGRSRGDSKTGSGIFSSRIAGWVEEAPGSPMDTKSLGRSGLHVCVCMSRDKQL